MLLLLRRRRRTRRATAGKRRPEALLLLLLIPRRSKTAAPSTSSDVRRRPARVVHAHAGRAAHGRPPPASKPSGPRRPRRRVGLRRGAPSGAGDGPRGDRLREQELGVVVSDVGAVLEARVVLVADDRLRVVFREREKEGTKRGREREEVV